VSPYATFIVTDALGSSASLAALFASKLAAVVVALARQDSASPSGARSQRAVYGKELSTRRDAEYNASVSGMSAA
jgi:hypothetical protein